MSPSLTGPFRAKTNFQQDGRLGTLLLLGMAAGAFVVGFDPLNLIYVEGLSEFMWWAAVILGPLSLWSLAVLVFRMLTRTARTIEFAELPRHGATVRVHAVVPRVKGYTVKNVLVELVGSRNGGEFVREQRTVPNVGEPAEFLDFDLAIPILRDDLDPASVRWRLVITPVALVPIVKQEVPVESMQIRVADLQFA
jgi:hypothetical protein